ncbi:MAG: hypothetical protein CR988_00765 [Treponema sp.]|nr:MAG: hypothetical protein CR988_00765 [Treponema sp.]
MLGNIFRAVATAISIYSLLCIVRIFMSWMPEILHTSVGRFFRMICDPFLDMFRSLPFTRVGIMDLSPIFAIGSLSILQMIFEELGRGTLPSARNIVMMIIAIIFSFIGFMITILIVIVVVRLIYELLNRSSYSPFWQSIDGFIMPIVTRISRFFAPKKMLSVTAGLSISLAVLVIIRVGLKFLMMFIL